MTFPPHTSGHWRQHSEHDVHISNMGMPTMVAPYNGAQHIPGVQGMGPVSPVSPRMEGSMPAFPAHTMAASMAYRPGVFAYDPMPSSHFNVQQSIPVAYSPVSNPIPHYTGNREVSNDRPHISHERTFPPAKVDQSHPMTPESPYAGGSGSALPDQGSAPATTNNTPKLVDNLMKKIQERQTVQGEPSRHSSSVCVLIYLSYIRMS